MSMFQGPHEVNIKPKIDIVDDSTRHAIRAGNDIQDFCQGVNELVSNSIDAKSTLIKVVFDIEKCFLLVEDDGRGISKENMSIVGVPNATSKLNSANAQNLFLTGSTPSTIGFRGEGIYALSCIGIVSITSRPRNLPECATYRKIIKSGKVLSEAETSDSGARKFCGTVVSVSKFFYNMPIRQKLLKASRLQLRGQIILLMESFALCHYRTEFHLFDVNESIWKHPACNSMHEAFVSLFGSPFKKRLDEINIEGEKIKIFGLASLPLKEAMQLSSNLQFVFVNSRLTVGFSALKREINRMYREHFDETQKDGPTPRNRNAQIAKKKAKFVFPAFCLAISCPSDLYDILLEPTKSVVKFRSEDVLRNLVRRMLKRFLRKKAIGKKNHFPEASLQKIDNQKFPRMQATASSQSNPVDLGMFQDIFSTTTDEDAGTNKNHETLCTQIPSLETNCSSPTDEWTNYNIKLGKPKPAPRYTRSQNTIYRSGTKLSIDLLRNISVIAQVGRKFILVRSNKQLLCFDQHAVDERINLENFETELKKGLNSQILSRHFCDASDGSIVCLDTHQQLEKFLTAKNQLGFWGYSAEMGTSNPLSLRIISLPALFGVPVPKDSLVETLEYAQTPELLETGPPPAIRRAIVSRACRTAIKFGDDLSTLECAVLMKKLVRCQFPFQCAHGRPTCCPLVKMHVMTDSKENNYDSKISTRSSKLMKATCVDSND